MRYPLGTKAYDAEQGMRMGPTKAPESDRVVLLERALEEARLSMQRQAAAACCDGCREKVLALDTEDVELP